jgi:phosphatidylglycerophosphate synthase
MKSDKPPVRQIHYILAVDCDLYCDCIFDFCLYLLLYVKKEFPMTGAVILFLVLFTIVGVLHSPLIKAHDYKPHSAIGELHHILEVAVVAQLLVIIKQYFGLV